MYLHNSPQKYREYKKQGIKFQLNLLSITGYYGKGIQKVALKLLQDKSYDFVASDAHNTRHINIIKESKIPKHIVPLLDKLTLRTIEEFL